MEGFGNVRHLLESENQGPETKNRCTLCFKLSLPSAKLGESLSTEHQNNFLIFIFSFTDFTFLEILHICFPRMMTKAYFKHITEKWSICSWKHKIRTIETMKSLLKCKLIETLKYQFSTVAFQNWNWRLICLFDHNTPTLGCLIRTILLLHLPGIIHRTASGEVSPGSRWSIVVWLLLLVIIQGKCPGHLSFPVQYRVGPTYFL